MSQQDNNQNKPNSLEALKKLYSLVSSTGGFSTRKNDVAEALRKVTELYETHREINRGIMRQREETAAQQQPVKQTAEEAALPPPAQKRSETAPQQGEVKPEKAATTAPPAPKTRTQIFDTGAPRTPSYVRGIANITLNEPRPKRPQGSRPPYVNSANAPHDRSARPPMGTRPAPGQGRPVLSRPPIGGGANIALPLTQNKSRKVDTKKKDATKPGTFDDKKSMNKRTLIRKGFIQEDFDEDRIRIRKLKNKKKMDNFAFEPKRIDSVVITSNQVTVKSLSEMMGVSAQDIIKKMMMMGGTPVKSINDFVEFETLFLVAEEFDVKLTLKLEQTKEEKAEALHDETGDDENLVTRPPVIAVMGHVDHGKTSLLDAIRKTNVAVGEAGGITQHIGAYTVNWEYEKKKRSITFLDTPGHEAFTEMRARGAKVTDIVVLVVAADDGVQPQTVEAINHVKAAGVPMIVAVNKIDKVDANIEKIKQELSMHNVLTTEWGGDITMVPLSAKKNTGIDVLLQEILFLADYNNYKANPDRKARGTVVEARLDKGKGPVVTVLVQNGTLRVGDAVVTGKTYGKIRAMTDSHGKPVKEALPSMPVSVLGISDVPNAGDPILVVDDEKMAKQIVGERDDKTKSDMLSSNAAVSLDDALKLQQSEQKDLSVIIKADVQGSAEALRNVLMKKENEEVKVIVAHSGVGAINKSDIMLAEVTGAILIGFNVKLDNEAKSAADAAGIRVIQSNIIYDVIDEVDAAMSGMVEPKYKDTVIGHAQVRNIFKISNTGTIAGCYVLDGKMQRNAKAIVRRGKDIVYEGVISGLKHFKDDAKEMNAGFECGIYIDGFTAYAEEDEIEAIISERIN